MNPSSSKLSPLSKPAHPSSFDSSAFSYKNSTFDEVLEDLQSRFIVNLPPEEIYSEERACFQVEQAHWYYEDFIREENPALSSYTLKAFSEMFFNNCPILSHFVHDHAGMFTRWMSYKIRVPVCGAIMLDQSWEYCVLVKGWKASAGWSFPKGKINEDEPKEKCAIREVLEETGYNLAGELNPDHILEVNIKEQEISLFVVPDVPMDYAFQTRTRKEISKIEWFRLSDLPAWKRNSQTPNTKFYLIAPFISQLQRFIHDRRPRPPRRTIKAKKPNTTGPIKGEIIGPNSDHAQESSSQSSGNDIPDTPSPHHVISAPHVVESEPNPTDSDMSRLLSRLAASATTDTGATSLPLSGSVKGENQLSDSTIIPDHHPISPPCTSTPQTQHLPSALSPSVPCETIEQVINESHVTSPVSPTTSVSSRPSRRTASMADVSPYLSRSAEIPTAKRLRELALLELVADESAKMSVFLRQSPTPGPPTIPIPTPLSPQVAPLSVNPHYPPQQALFYASNPQIPAGPVASYYSNFPRPATALPEMYLPRPNTSQTYHRSPMMSNSNSMSHAQMSSLMGSSTISSPMQQTPSYNTHPNILPHQGLYSTPPLLPQPNLDISPGGVQMPNRTLPPHLRSQNTPPPRGHSPFNLGTSPVATRFQATTPSHRTNALLSILNARPSPGTHLS